MMNSPSVDLLTDVPTETAAQPKSPRRRAAAKSAPPAPPAQPIPPAPPVMSDEQRDLFDSPLRGRIKSERSIMAYPFFALTPSRAPDGPMQYDDGMVRIEIHPGPAGIATIYDKDLIIYLASLMTEKINAGETPQRTYRFTAHDFLRVARRDTSARGYAGVKSMLERLQGTQIRTNIEAGGEGYDGLFSWLDSAHMRYRRSRADGQKTLIAVEVTLCDWLYQGILKDGRMLTVHEAYFDLSPLERRLYDVARAQCGNQPGFKIGLEKLHKRVGATGHLRTFRRQIDDIAERRALPEYDIALSGDPRRAIEAGLIDADEAKPRARTRRDAAYNLIVWFRPRTRGAPNGLALPQADVA